MDSLSVQLIALSRDLGRLTEKVSRFKKDGRVASSREISNLSQKLIKNVSQSMNENKMDPSKLKRFEHIRKKAQSYLDRMHKEDRGSSDSDVESNASADPFASFDELDVFDTQTAAPAESISIEDPFAQFNKVDVFEKAPLEASASVDAEMELQTPKTPAERVVSDFVKDFGINGLDVDKFNSSAYMEGLKSGPEAAVMAVLNHEAEIAAKKALKSGDEDGVYNAALNACKKLLI